MAQYQLNQPDLNFTDSRRAVPGNTDESSIIDYSETESIASLRDALNTHDAVTYSSANLDVMNVNDMIFAWRNIKNPKSIADYIEAQE